MAAIIDPAFKIIPRYATAFIIWRIENMQVVTIPREQYGKFFSGDSYIIYAASEYGRPSGIDAKTAQVSGTLEIHLHFWLGARTSLDEAGVAAFKTVELDDYLGGHCIQHREVQGNESARFKSYFKSGMRVLSGLCHSADKFEPSLYRVKGRRSPVTVQLPDISWDHFCSGDVLILHTKDVVFVWVGRNASPPEKLHATKVATRLRDEHGSSSVVFVDDGFEHRLQGVEKLLFNQLLNMKERRVKPTHDGSNGVQADTDTRGLLTLYHCSEEEGLYKVVEVKSGPLYQADLSPEDSFIIDNGLLGIWVWVGRRASPKERVEAMRNAHGFVTKKGYPNHTPVTRVVDGAEPPEFKMLFDTWKDRVIATSAQNKTIPGRVAVTVHTRLDAASLQERPQLAAESQLLDDGSGRTLVRRVTGPDLCHVPPHLYGIFFSTDCYLVQYTYSAGDTERHVIYYWLGYESLEEDGALAAQKAAELDAELGGAAVRVRVVQGKEPPHFLAIFSGCIVIFRGPEPNLEADDGVCEEERKVPESFLLQVQGNQVHNTKAIQVELCAASLNTNNVFLLKTSQKNNFLWFGKGSTGDEREMAKKVANFVLEGTYEVVYEGQEKQNLWDAIGGKEEYDRKKKNFDTSNFAPARLFQCSNASGKFVVEEVLGFTQSDLVQEDVMLLDTRDVIYIWIGRASNKEECERAIETALEYLRTDPAERDEETPIVLVKQGHEPPTFTGFFPTWESELWDDYKSFEEVRCDLEGKNPILKLDAHLIDGEKCFEDFAKYPVELLRVGADELPSDVNRTRREMMQETTTMMAAPENRGSWLNPAVDSSPSPVTLFSYKSLDDAEFKITEHLDYNNIAPETLPYEHNVPEAQQKQINGESQFQGKEFLWPVYDDDDDEEEDDDEKEDGTMKVKRTKSLPRRLEKSSQTRHEKHVQRKERKLLSMEVEQKEKEAAYREEVHNMQMSVLAAEKMAHEARHRYYVVKARTLEHRDGPQLEETLPSVHKAVVQ